ncbi:MAG: hypothetical protein R6U32_00180 [Candidatus Woesearchaeota archaeon]
MTYLSYSGSWNSGCSSSFSGCSTPSEAYSSGSSIDSIISDAGRNRGGMTPCNSMMDYSAPSASALEMNVENTPYAAQPMTIEVSHKPEELQYRKLSGITEKGAQETSYNTTYDSDEGYAIRGKADYFTPSTFLRPERPRARFVGSVEGIRDYIEEAFKATTGKDLPEDISIEVMSQDDLMQRHRMCNGTWNPGIQGFSINRKGFGQSLIAVRENELDMLMMVIGHELGHVLSFQLPNQLDEEAKAFAFEMAWIKALYDNNIAGLRESIDPNPKPAKNGLHDRAFAFVKGLLMKGADAFDIFTGLMKREMEVEHEHCATL